jgi:hypothetical protein
LAHQIDVRLDPKVNRLIRSVASARGQDVSNFVRALIKAELARLSYLSPDEKKALGIRSEPIVGGQEN